MSGDGPMWTPVCRLDELTPGRGVAALLGDGPDTVQVAIFRVDDTAQADTAQSGTAQSGTAQADTAQAGTAQSGTAQVFAVGNRDPFSGAYVIARGLTGSRGDAAVVASPMYKQRFDLRTGQCLDDPTVALPVYPVRVQDGLVEVGMPAPAFIEL